MAKIHIDKWKDVPKNQNFKNKSSDNKNPTPYKSKGLGDTIEKITMITGIKKVVDTISEATGTDCGCEERKAKLNNPNLLVNRVFYKDNTNNVF